MWSIILVITVMGVMNEYHLPRYYDTGDDCETAIDRIMKRAEPREGVDATIQCVEGWHVNFTIGGGTNAH